MDFAVTQNILETFGSSLFRGCVVLLVISAVIFVHELGHYLAARAANVKVERFSIGLGPVILRFNWGETEYALSAIPLGGYVKMLGQTDTPEVEEPDTDPRSYQSKSVPWRMLIISAGVIMNLIFGFILYAFAFSLGVPYTPAVIGTAYPGMPAWKAGIREGDKLIAINGVKRDNFEDIRRQVVLANPNKDYVQFEMSRISTDGKERRVTFDVRPMKEGSSLQPQIGVLPANGLTIVMPNPEDGGKYQSPIDRAAEPAFRTDDTIQTVNGQPVANSHQFQRIMYRLKNEPVTIGVVNEKKTPSTQEIKVEPNHVRTLGLVMSIGNIEAVRPDSPASKAVNAETGEPLPIMEKDQIKSVDGVENLDPMRLPDLFSEKAGVAVIVEIVREGPLPQTLKVKVVPEAIPPWNDFPSGIAFESKDKRFPCSIPAIGVAYQVGRSVRRVEEGGAAAKAEPAIQPGDEIVAAEFLYEGTSKPQPISIEVHNNWPQVFWNLQHPAISNKVVLTLQRKDAAGSPVKVAVNAQSDPNWYFADRGFRFVPNQALRQDTTILGAIGLGIERTKTSIYELYSVLKQVALGHVSFLNFSGPITIGAVTYRLADERIGLLLWFVAFLSINLAIINFLPIPILDGGHMVFLIYEGLFRKPPTGAIVAFLNYAGFIFLISLMLFVVSLDVLRFVGLVKM